MAISVGTAVTRALARTRYVLFTTFDIAKWLALALCAFLAQCESGSLISQVNNMPSSWMPRPPGTPPGPATMPAATSAPATQSATSMPSTAPSTQPVLRRVSLGEQWLKWITANVGWAVAFAASAMLVLIAIAALCSWISSRGQLMFIDGIVQNRAAIAEPWRACSHLGNSLFGWSLALNLVGLLLTAGIVGIGVAIAWSDLHSQSFGAPAITAIVVTSVLMLGNALAFTLIRMLLQDFVVPAMYLHNLRVRPAWILVKNEIISGYVGEVVLFYLMGIVVGLATATIATALSCATCCITALPYIGTVILLPLFVFKRCYALCFIDQFGPRWTVFFDASQRCKKCGYDLRYTPQSPACPECGTSREHFTASTQMPAPPPPPPTF